MSANYEHFVALQDAIVERLTTIGDAALQAYAPLPATANGKTIEIFHERIGDVGTKIRAAVGSLGIMMLVLTPAMKIPGARNSPQLAGDAPIIIQVHENVLINQGTNGSQVPALELIVFGMKRLHWWTPQLSVSSPFARTRLVLDEVPFALVHEEPTLVYNLALHAPLNLSAPLREPA